MPTQIPAQGIAAGAITADKIAAGAVTAAKVAEGVAGGPKITSVAVTNNSYTVLDDTAVDTAGGYIKITGTGFVTGCSVVIGTTPATSTTFISASEVRAQVPAQSAGSYFVYVVNPDGGTATRVNGLTYSASPVWVTGSSLNDASNQIAYSYQLSATGATSYSLQSGSSLPTGATLSSGGLLSGNTTVGSNTAYSFTIVATDAENQDSPRTFSLNVNIPPAAGQIEYSPGTYSWTAPSGVTSVSVVAVGGGGGGSSSYNSSINKYYGSGGGGGGLGWKNNIAVTPGQSYTVVVGSAGAGESGSAAQNGGNSYFISLATVAGYGGNAASLSDTPGSGGSYVGDGGGSGSSGTQWNSTNLNNNNGSSTVGPGGNPGGYPGAPLGGVLGAGGGGTTYGKGGDGGYNYLGPQGGPGQGGRVRIIWGDGRAFPSTNTADV